MILGHRLRTLATLAAPLATPVERIGGRWHGSSEPGELVFAGLPATADFVAEALLRIERRETVATLGSPLALRGRTFAAVCAAADLVVAEVPPLWRAFLPAGTAFRLPAWVSQEIAAPEGEALGLPAALRSEAARHTRREGYTVAWTQAQEDIQRFYARQYLPYIAARFGAGAIVVDERRFLAVSRGMTLAMLRVGGDWVAGLLFSQSGATLSLGWFGAASMPPHGGASEVLDVSVIERAASRGVRRVVMGHSRPSLADGVVRYKVRFGARVRPTRFPQRVIGIAVPGRSAALAAALDAAQFVEFPGSEEEPRALRFSRPVSAGSPATAPST